MVMSTRRFQPCNALRIFSSALRAWLQRAQRLQVLRLLPVQLPRWLQQVRAHRQTCLGLRRAR